MKWKVSVLACILHVQFPGAGKGSAGRGSWLDTFRGSFVCLRGSGGGAKDLVFLLKLVFPKSMGRGAARARVPPGRLAP